MNRRILTIPAAVCTIAALFIMSLCTSCKPAPEKKIGIQLYTVMRAMQEDPYGSVDRLAGMGYNSFELVQWGGDPKVFGLPANEFKALCDKYGIEILSTHSGIQEEPEKEEEIMNRWRALFEVQKSLGGKYFVIPGYGVDHNVADVQRMCDYFNRVGRLASEYGLKLGYHNHDGEYGKLEDSDAVMWEYLVENTDPQYVCFELDVYWCVKGGKDPVEYLKKYPSRIELLHVKDELVIGASGNIDFEAIFNQFYANGMSDYVVEIESPSWLYEKTNEDGTKYTAEQITEEMFKASAESAEYLRNAPFVK